MSNPVVERLNAYYSFPAQITERVAQLADEQKVLGYQDFLAERGVAEPFTYTYDGNSAISVLDIRPDEYDESIARVYHLPMANPLNPNMIYQAATVQATQSDVRLIAVGNPSGPGHRNGALPGEARKKVAKGELKPVVEPLRRYLDDQGLVAVDHIGYSYGAETAAEAASQAVPYDMEVRHSVHIEPVAVTQRNLLELGYAFRTTEKELENYVQSTNTLAFFEARKASGGLINYSLGLLRLTNIAIAKALGLQNGFESRMDAALSNSEEMKSTVIWGTESELATDGVMRQLTGRLRNRYPGRVASMPIAGQKHALANDIHLQAALVLEGLHLPAS